MRESQYPHTLFITPHLLGKQPNITALPQNPRAEKLTAGEAPRSPSQPPAQPGSPGRMPPDELPYLQHGQSQGIPELLIHVFGARPSPPPSLPGLPAAIATLSTPDLGSSLQQFPPGPPLSPLRSHASLSSLTNIPKHSLQWSLECIPPQWTDLPLARSSFYVRGAAGKKISSWT